MTMSQRLQDLAARNGILLGVVILIVVFTLMNGRFFSTGNAQAIGLQIAAVGVIALPLALLVIGGSVDLSVGSVVSLAAVAAGQVMGSSDSVVLAIVVALGVGAAAGAINGIFVCVFKLNAIVVTLGSLAVWAGVALLWSDGHTLATFPQAFSDLGTLKIFGLSFQIYVVALVAALSWFLLSQRSFGRELRAVGANERAAFLMGVGVKRVRFLAFVYVGVAAALSAILLTAQLQAASPTVGVGLEIQALTVVLLGGVAFTGGVGGVSGVVAGLLFVGVLRNGLVVVGASGFVQQVLLGGTLIGAVALDAFINDRRRRAILRAGADASDRDGASAPQMVAT
jgi:ribose/xylose/arabinose/galactoside ABC-type transport system permease subunit